MKTVQQSKGVGDNNCGLDGPNHNETNRGDGNDNVLGGTRKKEGGEDVGNDDNIVGKTCDGDNRDGDNSDGIVNNIGGNDSNDVVNPPDSGDTVGEVNSVSGTSTSPRSPREGTKTPIHWLQLINECDTPVNLQEMLLSQVNSVFPIIYCTNQNNIDDKLNWAPCILKKIHQDQYKNFDQHETFKVSKGLFGMAMRVFVICGAYSLSIPPRHFSRHFVLRLPMVAMIVKTV